MRQFASQVSHFTNGKQNTKSFGPNVFSSFRARTSTLYSINYTSWSGPVRFFQKATLTNFILDGCKHSIIEIEISHFFTIIYCYVLPSKMKMVWHKVRKLKLKWNGSLGPRGPIFRSVDPWISDPDSESLTVVEHDAPSIRISILVSPVWSIFILFQNSKL